ncbi:MAG TPA: class I SAM-dependent methyltransferase [Chitinophaga sp.]|uniref:class I SAM-dependent methyltransferase n=1 Tax=Chitinophaga sp. TaxID=1869181 RepID=UPI002C317DF9|nr:class I SAM-dependent methyltransferase [Chitinophaga sp.]HVI46910.1 class I SAM-dependent methyltransferase [Chitinophaga sp.]
MSDETVIREDVEKYYDEHITGKLTGFIDGNPRNDAAWDTLISHLSSPPQTILEIGCGIGDMSFKMHQHFPEAKITGLDISPKSIEIANRLFSSGQVDFVAGILDDEVFAGKKFDLIVLFDVYEHIPNEIRASFDRTLNNILSDTGIIFLAFPTPQFQTFLKQHSPELIQPVDEDIDVHTIASLAAATNTNVIIYKEVKVWRQGDYAHAFLRKADKQWGGAVPLGSISVRIKRGISKVIRNNGFISARKSRIALVRKKLGDIIPNKF